MAKKQIRKNSRAARQAPEIDIEVDDVRDEDAKTRVLKELAEKEMRSGGPKPALEGMDELTAIAQGIHPDQRKPAGKVAKKKGKKDKRKMERAEMIKDMLSEKIDLAKKRHKTVRNYRADDDEE